MSSAAVPSPVSAGFGLRRALMRHRGALIAAAVLAILLFIVDWISAGPLTYFDVSFLSSGGATSALAAVGQTIVILSGGFDLSAGAVITLVTVVLASSMDPMAHAPGSCCGRRSAR